MTRRKQRRPRLGPDLDRLVNVRQVLDDGDQPIDAPTRNWLIALLDDILADIDVRGRFHETVAHRPANQDPAFWCAMWIAERTRHDRADRLTVTEAKLRAESLWSCGEEQVRRAWLAHHRQAKAIIAGTRSPEGLARVIEWHRSRCKKSW